MQPRIFNTKGPLDPDKDDEILVERRELWQIIRLATQPTVYSYAAILSPRQTGKTTLLHDARSVLAKQSCGVAYVDLSPLEGRDEASCYQYVCRQILADLAGHLRLQRPAREKLEAVTGPVAFRAFLKEVALRARPPRLVIMLDEAKAIPDEISSAFFGTIRSVFTSRRKESEQELEKYVFVLAGATELYELTSGENSPLNICEKIYLQDLDAQDVAKVASNLERAGCQVTSKGSHYLYEQTRGHPYLTQRICALLELHQAPALTPASVDQAVNELLRGDDNLEHITRQLGKNPKAKAVALQLLHAEEPVAFSRVNPILSQLEMIGVVADADTCQIRNPIYEAALRRYFDLDRPAPTIKKRLQRGILTGILALLFLLPLPTIYLYLTEVVFADRFVSEPVTAAPLEVLGYVRHDSLLGLNEDQDIEIELQRAVTSPPVRIELHPRETDLTSADGKYTLVFESPHESQRFWVRLQKNVRLQDAVFPFLMERRRHIDLYAQGADQPAATSVEQTADPMLLYTAVVKLDYFSSFIGSLVVWGVSLFAGLGSILSHLDTIGDWRSHLARLVPPRRRED